MKRLRTALACVACALYPFAANAAAILTPEDVMRSAASSYPKVLMAIADLDAARGGLLEEQSAFDVIFEVETDNRVAGFYDGQTVETKFTRNIGPFGGKVYGGYRVSDGDFPVYEDISFTNQGGEFKLGGLFSLLRDRSIDSRRFGVRDQQLAINQADVNILLTRIGVQQKALIAYWRWVTAGQRLAIYRDLLELAQQRDSGLRRQVERGAQAAIFLTENAQNITRRRILVRQAERDLDIAAADLSLYVRDAEGAVIVPTRDQLPMAFSAPSPDSDVNVNAVVAQRPEIRLVALEIDRALQRQALARNEFRPRLDLSVEVSDDIGEIGEGGESRDEAEAIVGLRFEAPLGARLARGKSAAAKASLDRLEHEQRLLTDQIAAELDNMRIRLTVATDLAGLASQEVRQAELLREAEMRRFANGASDFFLVNLREEAVTDAQIRYTDSLFTANAARVTFDAATLNLSALGL